MSLELMLIPAFALLGAAFVGAACWGAWQVHRVIPQRLQRLEEALRVYNGANATLGRQLADLEAQLQTLREAAVQKPAEATPARPVQSAAERYGIKVPPPEFTEAELRLSQLIKSRLASLRLN